MSTDESLQRFALIALIMSGFLKGNVSGETVPDVVR